MADLVNVMIGGEAVAVPPVMNLAALERVWPAVTAMSAADNMVAMAGSAAAVISAALLGTRPDLTVPEIKNRIRVNVEDGTDERAGLIRAANELLVASGLVKKSEPGAGEAAPADAPA